MTHCYPVPGKKAVACNLGGNDGCSLFALTYEGELEGLATGERNARIEVLRVGVPGANSPSYLRSDDSLNFRPIA